jgi:hypothetical protein
MTEVMQSRRKKTHIKWQKQIKLSLISAGNSPILNPETQ